MEPTVELISAIFARLRAIPAITDLVGTKIYDNPPNGSNAPTSPYISLQGGDAITEEIDCIEGYEVTLQIDIWSWGIGEAYSSAQVRKIAHEVKKALNNYELPIATNALVSLQHNITRYLRDDENAVNHAAVSITAIIEGQ